MEFEPIDEGLENALRDILDRVDGCTSYADGIDFLTPEYRALKGLGFFEEADEYMDCTASVKPTYEALRYFERKDAWEKEKTKAAVGGAVGKVVDKAVDIGVSIGTKMGGF